MSSTNLDTKPKPNAKQQECIDSIDGSIMVLAGPGTGKTFTVIERIKNMLLRGIEPSKISVFMQIRIGQNVIIIINIYTKRLGQKKRKDFIRIQMRV